MTVELAQLEPDDIVVDIGCGSGEAVREAAARLTSGRAIGVDPTPAMIRFANKLSESHDGGERIEFIESPAERLPIADNSVTVALAINSLHHWDDPTVGLAEAMRILKPGGRLLVTAEEPEDGKFGHGEGPLAEPGSVTGAIADAGFTDVVLSRHAEGDVRMLAVAARKSAG